MGIKWAFGVKLPQTSSESLAHFNTTEWTNELVLFTLTYLSTPLEYQKQMKEDAFNPNNSDTVYEIWKKLLPGSCCQDFVLWDCKNEYILFTVLTCFCNFTLPNLF